MEQIDFEQFDKEWLQLAREICQAIYIKPRSQELKNVFQKNGFLSMEEQGEFIDICDKTKYDCIYEKYGPEGSDGYKKFSQAWQQWFEQKGVESNHNRGQRNSVEHILFGSTPDPARFLLHFEQEMLGSMKADA